MGESLEIFTFNALGGTCELQFAAPDHLKTAEISDTIQEMTRRVQSRYSRYDPNSTVSRINQAAGGRAVEVDNETARLIDYAARCFDQSGGLFDITAGVLRRAWDFKTKRIPTDNDIDQLLPLIGWNKVEWDGLTIRLPLAGMEIDLGGVGKEFAVDAAVGELLRMGVRHALVNFGGDLRVIGGRPDGSPWSVGVVHPRKFRGAIATVHLIDAAISTSGDYERYFEVEGERYCHILNPTTGRPVRGLQSVSVITELCLVAGSMSTIAMLLGPERGVQFLKDSGCAFLCVDENGVVHESSPDGASQSNAA